MAGLAQFARDALRRVRIARYQRKVAMRDFTFRAGQAHLERAAAGIKDFRAG